MLTIYATVGLSVLAHGLTAAPLAGRYARWFARIRTSVPAMESAPAEVTRLRGPAGHHPPQRAGDRRVTPRSCALTARWTLPWIWSAPSRSTKPSARSTASTSA